MSDQNNAVHAGPTVRVSPIAVSDSPGAHQVWIDRGDQHFMVGEPFDEWHPANVFADALRQALSGPNPSPAVSEPTKAVAHPDDLAVDEFAVLMKAKLAQARAKGRGGWDDDEVGMQRHLSNLLREHVEKGDPLDVANFCMFLSMRGEPIASASASAAAVGEVFEKSGVWWFKGTPPQGTKLYTLPPLPAVDDAFVEQVLSTRRPGGSQVWDVVNGGGMCIDSNHRNTARVILEAAFAKLEAGGR